MNKEKNKTIQKKNKTIQEKNKTEQTARSRLKNKEDINKIIFDFFRNDNENIKK